MFTAVLSLNFPFTPRDQTKLGEAHCLQDDYYLFYFKRSPQDKKTKFFKRFGLDLDKVDEYLMETVA